MSLVTAKQTKLISKGYGLRTPWTIILEFYSIILRICNNCTVDYKCLATAIILNKGEIRTTLFVFVLTLYSAFHLLHFQLLLSPFLIPFDTYMNTTTSAFQEFFRVVSTDDISGGTSAIFICDDVLQ